MLMDYGIYFKEINCDQYLKENKHDFLCFIKTQANKQHNTFPIVFDESMCFIGGYTETVKYLEKINIQFQEEF
jgi:hypothetical protein